MKSDVVTQAVIDLLNDNRELVTDSVVKRKRFESWLQENLFDQLSGEVSIDHVERERFYADSQERCDIWYSKAGKETWLELKCCVTNYLHRFTQSSTTQNITNEIGEIIRDANKLARLPVSFERRILFLGYPLPADYKDHSSWSAHLQRIDESPGKIVDSHEVALTRNEESALIVLYDCQI